MLRTVIYMMLFTFGLSVLAQKNDTLSYAEQLAALEAEMDSLSIFNLIESVLSMESDPKSELNVHFGFTSSVTTAGRDYDINQQGISPGLSYYHKSGIYADVSGYWNSDIEPNYNPTVFSLGYLNALNEKWSYSFDYERWFFNPKDSSENPLTNSLGTSLNYDFKIATLGVDYSFLFGNETAHRIIGNLGSTIKLGKWWIFDDIRMYPSASIFFGNGKITQLRITQQQLNERERRQTEFLLNINNLSDDEIRRLRRTIILAFRNDRITEQRRNELLQLISATENLTENDVDELQQLLDEGFEVQSFEDGNAFGLMNYSFSLPLSLSIKNLNIILVYTYSIPVALPGEYFEIDPIGYFSASISYRIPFK